MNKLVVSLHVHLKETNRRLTTCMDGRACTCTSIALGACTNATWWFSRYILHPPLGDRFRFVNRESLRLIALGGERKRITQKTTLHKKRIKKRGATGEYRSTTFTRFVLRHFFMPSKYYWGPACQTMHKKTARVCAIETAPSRKHTLSIAHLLKKIPRPHETFQRKMLTLVKWV